MGQTATAIPEKIYFKIGEVCDLVGVQAHVLRYWETEFPQLSPQKNRSGQRSYRRKDVEISLRIKELLYDDMYTIAGARKKLQTELKPETPKLKIVRPEPLSTELEVPNSFDAPGLFDEDISLDEVAGSIDQLSSGKKLESDQIDALKSLAEHLLELRVMLNKGRKADSGWGTPND